MQSKNNRKSIGGVSDWFFGKKAKVRQHKTLKSHRCLFNETLEARHLMAVGVNPLIDPCPTVVSLSSAKSQYASASASAITVGVNLIVNGDFEDPSLNDIDPPKPGPKFSFFAGATGKVIGWNTEVDKNNTHTGTDLEIQANGLYDDPATNTYFVVPSGRQYIELDAHKSTIITQTITKGITPQGIYELSFLNGGRPLDKSKNADTNQIDFHVYDATGATPIELELFNKGVKLTTKVTAVVAPGTWTNNTYTFTAPKLCSKIKVTFGDGDSKHLNDSYGSFLDRVSVKLLTPAFSYITDRRSASTDAASFPIESTPYAIKEDEHFDNKSSYTFQLVGPAATNAKIQARVKTLNRAVADVVYPAGTTLFDINMANFQDNDKLQIVFKDSRAGLPAPLTVTSPTFTIKSPHAIHIAGVYSDLVATGAVAGGKLKTDLQNDLTKEAALLTSRDSADDWRAIVKIQVDQLDEWHAQTTLLTSALPQRTLYDPIDNNAAKDQYNKKLNANELAVPSQFTNALPVQFYNLALVSKFDFTPPGTIGLPTAGHTSTDTNNGVAVINWPLRKTATIIHELGHRADLLHPTHTSEDIMFSAPQYNLPINIKGVPAIPPDVRKELNYDDVDPYETKL